MAHSFTELNDQCAEPNLQARRRQRSAETPPNEIPLLEGSLCSNDLLSDPSVNQKHFATVGPKQLWDQRRLSPAAVQRVGGPGGADL